MLKSRGSGQAMGSTAREPGLPRPTPRCRGKVTAPAPRPLAGSPQLLVLLSLCLLSSFCRHLMFCRGTHFGPRLGIE